MICGKRKTFNSGIYFRSKVNALQGSGSNFSYWIAGWALPRLMEAFEETERRVIDVIGNPMPSPVENEEFPSEKVKEDIFLS